MVTLRDSLLSSSARKLPIRRRPDLVARRQHYLGRSYWIVKDPVGLQYFRFQEEEYAILQMLDGYTSLDEIKEKFEEDFPPQKITLEELQQFLGMLHRSGLIVADVAGQGRQLHKRRDERKRKQFFAAATNILCIRFKGFDPERVLNWLNRYVGWLYTRTAGIIAGLFALSALLLVAVQFDVFRSKLPEFQQFFSVHNGFLLAGVLGVTKILHEFGHGLSCKRFGGECHEMGIMVLVLTPCLYCNVSDSWMLPSKWQRAAIGAAGMYIELILASFCTYLWWFSQPGLFHNLCLNVMFVSSLSTVVFNANPLLRYDGYYILADLAEIPNLRQKATQVLSRKLGEWCLGLEPPEDPFLPQRNQLFFALYSIAAAFYRWVVALSICWFLYKLFQSYNLEVLGQLVVIMSLWGLLVMPVYQVGKFFYVPGRLDQVKKSHFYTSLSIVVVLLGLFFFLPLPHNIMCTFELQARDAAPVYVDVAGNLTTVDVQPGQYVSKGQLLASLHNNEIDLEVSKLAGTKNEYETRLASLLQQSIRDRRAVMEKPQVLEALKAVDDQLKEKARDQQRLRLIAPIAGFVLPPTVVMKHEDTEERLPTWSGTPFDIENLGCHLDQGVLFCQIGDPKKLEAVMIVDQAERNLIRNGQRVEIKLEGHASQTIETKISEISESELKVSPRRLSTRYGGELPTKTDPQSGNEKPQSTSYQAKAPVDDPDGHFLLGVRGQAKIHADWLPLGTRLWRLISHTFNFKL